MSAAPEVEAAALDDAAAAAADLDDAAAEEAAALNGAAADGEAADGAEGGTRRSRRGGSAAAAAAAAAAGAQWAAPAAEIARRRNFAIISHPDAGKTTLTEKLLLYGGAIQEAGAVRSRADQRKATSDWMELEKQRGISITSTVLSFEYAGAQINLLDTPGHQDFSEDTYRTLAAADNAVMLVDAAKGLEPQTRKLFEVCRLRGLPIFTFCNKLDRPSLSPFELLDQIEGDFGLQMVPVLWPIGDGPNFQGVLDRDTNLVHLFERGDRTGRAKEMGTLELDDPELPIAIGETLYNQLREDVEVLEGLIEPLDMAKVHAGEQSPMFFGSAMVNFGVELFLKRFLTLGQGPAPRSISSGGNAAEQLTPEYPEFTGFCFKLQANLDPRHRDRLAYIRVVSGRFEKGMRVSHSRMKGRTVNLTQAQQLFAQDRESVSEAFPGDVIGLNNPGVFAIGDTIYTGARRVAFPGIPSFSPECFAYIRNPNPSTYKNYNKGLTQLLDEGAVQLLRERSDDGNGSPILAAVGTLQFDVVQYRLKDEYGVETRLEALPGFNTARWSNAGWDAVDAAEADGKLFGIFQAKDRFGRPVLLFRNEWKLQQVMADLPELELVPWAAPPDIV
ncbi:PRF3, plastid translation release factor RF3 [Tribonema minus]|uniref:PRF3, plastid translation release factor RF3 n=1 Tax=Tribonema minus TaxID=303371 RepID=A0A836C6V6_9STRA|nr:PRF3, plastid translation release factor RF3 [Tribonema minus]